MEQNQEGKERILKGMDESIDSTWSVFEEKIIFKARELLPTIEAAIAELEMKKTTRVQKKLQRFKRWREVLEQWQEKEVPDFVRLQRLEELRKLFEWERENYG
jgi:hypothetical protein